MASTCNFCTSPVKNGEQTVNCMGFCDEVVHLRCTKVGQNQKMNASFLKIINECDNLFWMCDECVKLMKIARFRFTMESVGTAMDNLQKEQDRNNSELRDLITKNAQQLLLLSKRVANAAPTSNRLLTPRSKSTPKRPRDSDRVPTKALVFGTNTAESKCAGITCIPPDENLFWLYVSRFTNNTTVSQVEGLVKNVIGAKERVQVSALVKRGIDPSSLPFISFKVGVAFAHKDAIMNPAVWPGYCGFREFEDLQRKAPSPRSINDDQMAKKHQSSSAVLVIPDNASSLVSPTLEARDPDQFLTPRSGNSDADPAAMEH